MNNQKNRLWTFCLSLVPGAGEMYFGLYREGISLMTAFLLLIIIPMTLNIGGLVLLAVVLWFYSFLHTHNLRAMPLEEFCQLEDRYFWEGIDFDFKWSVRYKNVVAVILIVIGAFLLWENLFSWLSFWLPDFFYSILYRLPRIILGVLIILLGVWLISGKKKALEQEEQDQEHTATTYTDIPAMPVYRSEFGADAPYAPDVTDAPDEETDSSSGESNPKEDSDHADA